MRSDVCTSCECAKGEDGIRREGVGALVLCEGGDCVLACDRREPFNKILIKFLNSSS